MTHVSEVELAAERVAVAIKALNLRLDWCATPPTRPGLPRCSTFLLRKHHDRPPCAGAIDLSFDALNWPPVLEEISS